MLQVSIILETAVGWGGLPSRKSAQAIDAPRKCEKALITNKVTTSFSNFLCTPISYTSFSRPTAVSRIIIASSKITCFRTRMNWCTVTAR